VDQVINSVAGAKANAGPQLAGPDLSFGAVPARFDQKMMTMEVTSDIDFKHDDSSFSCKQTLFFVFKFCLNWGPCFARKICFRSFPRRLYTARPIRGAPGVVVQKDYSVYLFTDPAVHGPQLECGPVELFGFNTGDFQVGEREVALRHFLGTALNDRFVVCCN
jgi:hypothetical protein